LERTASADFVTVARHDWILWKRDPTLPYHDQALKQVGSQARRFIAWCRGQVYLVLFGLLIFFQIATWLEIKDISHHSWTGCGREFPCHVIIDDQARRIIDNDDLARRIGEEVARKFKR
jgi:hypothetical protein